MNDYFSIEFQASEAYRQGRYQEAALYNEQVVRIARDRHLQVEAFSTGLHMATSWELAGYPLRALTLLTELLSNIPDGVRRSDLWSGYVQLFQITCAHQPDGTALTRQLEQLREFHSRHQAGSASDLHYLAGCLHEARGMWQNALVEFERAISAPGSFHRLMIFQILAQAVRVSLRLGRREDAGRFCKILGHTEADVDESRVAHVDACLRLTLWDSDLLRPAHYLYLSRLAELVSALQRPTWSRQLLTWQIRTLLLRPDQGDPLSPTHPAQALITTKVRGAWEVPDRYARALLQIDYRLACLRFALGLAPHDDLHNRTLASLPPTFDADRLPKHEIQRRVHLTHRTIQTAAGYATHLDQCFGSTWRTQEVEGRRARLTDLLTQQAQPLCPAS